MVDLRDLAQYTNRVVDLIFDDGHEVRAKLITVDADEPSEIIYDILEVRSAGPTELANVQAGTVASADATRLLRFRPV